MTEIDYGADVHTLRRRLAKAEKERDELRARCLELQEVAAREQQRADREVNRRMGWCEHANCIELHPKHGSPPPNPLKWCSECGALYVFEPGRFGEERAGWVAPGSPPVERVEPVLDLVLRS